MNIISFLSYRGGAAKTTLISKLASKVMSNGGKVLLVDLSPQSNLTQLYLSQTHCCNGTVKCWFEQYPNFIERDIFKEIVLPANKSKKAFIIPSHFSISQLNIEDKVEIYQLFSYSLRQFTKKELFDMVFIDCSADLDTLTKCAITASTDLFMLVMPIRGFNEQLSHFVTCIQRFFEALDNSFLPTTYKETFEAKFVGVLLTMVNENSRETIKKLFTKQSSIPILDNVITTKRKIGIPESLGSYTQKQHNDDIKSVIEEVISSLTLKSF